MMFSILWTIVSYVLGSILRMWSRSQEAKLAQTEAIMKLAGARMEDVSNARHMQSKDIQFTRRLVMLSVTGCLMFLMVYGTLTGMQMVIPMTTVKGSGFLGMLFGGGPSTVVDFIDIPISLTISMAWNIFAVMVGFYFGAGGTRV